MPARARRRVAHRRARRRRPVQPVQPRARRRRRPPRGRGRRRPRADARGGRPLRDPRCRRGRAGRRRNARRPRRTARCTRPRRGSVRPGVLRPGASGSRPMTRCPPTTRGVPVKFKPMWALGALAAAAAIAAGCGSSNDNGSSSSSGGGSKSGSIALLLPESKTARYESQDRPAFVNKLKQLCPDCNVIYSNADQDASKQQQQAEAALTKGAKVLVLDPVDSASAAAIVTRAKQQKVPVISYDRLITNADVDYYISFDNVQVGKLQGQSLVDQLKKKGGSGSVVMINGAPTDNNAKLFKQGAHSVIDKSGFKVAKEYDTPDWSPDKAQTEMEQAITAVGKSGFVGVYAANDGTAGGAIAAMKSN